MVITSFRTPLCETCRVTLTTTLRALGSLAHPTPRGPLMSRQPNINDNVKQEVPWDKNLPTARPRSSLEARVPRSQKLLPICTIKLRREGPWGSHRNPHPRQSEI